MAKKHYRIEISYNGKDVFGWQKQKDLPTIQGLIEESLADLSPHRKISPRAASRTDSGVHAISQVIKLPLSSRLKEDELREEVIKRIPKPIQVRDFRRTNPGFKVIHHVISKEYIYIFGRTELFPHIGTVFTEELPDNLDPMIEKMQEAANAFLGTHSFHNFQYRSDAAGGMIRRIDRFEIKKISNDHVAVIIRGNGFLRQMVRILVGVTINYSKNMFTLDDIKKAQTSDEKLKLGFISPPEGLILHFIEYIKRDDSEEFVAPEFSLEEIQKISMLHP